MVALDSMSIPEYLSRRVAMAATKRRERSNAARVPRTWVQGIVRLVLHLVGFSCFTVAGFWLSMPAGMIVAGLSCFCLSFLSTRSDSTVNSR
jgi:Na+-driven multidrug efflux pump